MEFNSLKNFKTAKKIQKQLLNSGFTPHQAEGILHSIMQIIEDRELVTKSFLKTALAELRAELRIEIAKSEKKMIMWMIGLQIATWALLFSLFKS